MRLRVGAGSETGRVRGNNEDAYSCRPELGLFIVCDGMGGERSGEVASRMAVDTILSRLGDSGAAGGASEEDARGFSPQAVRLEAALRAGNEALYEASRANAEHAGMGSTVVSAWITNSVANLAHVGDSRAYLWRGGRLEQLTRDHSLVEARMQAGLLTREEGLKSQDRNVLVRALGREPQVEVDLAEVPLTAGDLLLLCTDGLTQMVSDEGLADAISSLKEPQAISRRLLALADHNGGVDNATVVVVKLEADSIWRRLVAS